MTTSPRRVLVVGTGAPGGIGRVEQLVAEAALDDEQAFADEVFAIWRRTHPDYLGTEAIHALATPARGPIGDGRAYVGSLIGALRTVKPDYVMYMHANLARPAPYLRLFGHPARYAVWTYGVEIWEPLSWAHRTALRRADAVLTISGDSVKRTVETQGVAASRVQWIPLTLPEAMFDAARLSGDALPIRGRVLTVSRLAQTEGGKNIEALVRAMALVRQTCPSAHLVIVGDGDDRERMEQSVADAGLADAVMFTGRLSDDDLRTEYQRAELFALPSEKEGFGLVFVEAMLASRPVVGLARGGPLDIVRTGIDGELLERVEDLPETLSRLLADPASLRRMGEQGRIRVTDAFSPARFRDAVRAAVET